MQANFQLKGFLSSLILGVLLVQTGQADVNWDGDGTQGNFTWSENWYGNVTPSFNFAAGNLVFNFHLSPPAYFN